MKTHTAKSLLLLSFVLINLNHFIPFVLGCNGNYSHDNELKKEKHFNLKSGDDIKNKLKQQEVLADFLDKTKIRPIRITLDTTYLSETHKDLDPLTGE